MRRTTRTPKIATPCTHDHVERNNHSFYRFRCTDCRALVAELNETARAQMQPSKNHTRSLAVQS